MSKDEKMRQALSEVLKPGKERQDEISRLFGRMTGEISLGERVERLTHLLRQCRDEAKDLTKEMTTNGDTSGLTLLSVSELLEDCLRFCENIPINKNESRGSVGVQ